jgi:hypothetical protein
MLKGFKDFLSGHKSPEPTDEHPDSYHINKFHELHSQLEEHARHLHKRGYHIEIEYKSDMAARHGRAGKGSTLFFNQALHSPKDVSISKSALAIKR